MKQRVLANLTRYIEDQRGHAVIAKKKGKGGGGNDRSEFLKALMPLIGDQVIHAYTSNDLDSFQNAWTHITTRLLEHFQEETETDASVVVNVQNLRQQLVQLKRQNRQNPSKDLEDEIAKLSLRINNMVTESVPDHQKATHEYEAEQMRKMHKEAGY